MKMILGAAAAALMFGVVFSQPAEARCFWNGFQTVCTHHNWNPYWHPWHRHYWRGWY